MGTIQVNYDEVNAEIRRLRSHLTSQITSPINNEYRQIQSNLRQVDGATNANFREAMDENQRKTIVAANILDRLLHFIANSSRQIQINENQIARSFNASRR